jgi:hypothetical protein
MTRRMAVAAVVAIFGLVGVARAAEDPTGTWKWTTTYQGKSRDATVKLKLEGDKLTGTVPGQGTQEVAISDAMFKDGNVSFSVDREVNGQKITQKYSGTVSGDTIKGTIETTRGGQSQSREWEAKRQK